MASDFAIDVGVSDRLHPIAILQHHVDDGEQPAAWAPWILVLRLPPAASRPSFSSFSAKDLPIFVTSEPPAIGTTMFAGVRQPSCSAIS